MERVSENKKQAVGYLLGDLPDAERDRFEERLFLDEDLSLSLDAAENDLVDEYLRGELSGEQVVKFERNFTLAESRPEKLQIASVLQTKVFNEKPAAFAAAPPECRENTKSSRPSKPRAEKQRQKLNDREQLSPERTRAGRTAVIC